MMLTKIIKNIFIICMSVFTLCNCSVFSPIKTEPQNSYVINALPSTGGKKITRPITLLVMQPETNPIYDTTSMAYTTHPYQIAYFAKNHWAETPANMLKPLIVQALQNTHYFHAVVTPVFIGNYQYILSTQIQQLQQDYSHLPGILRLTLRAQLTKVINNRVMSAKQFTMTETISQNTPYQGVIAANEATAEMLAKLTRFCIESIQYQ